LSKRFSTIAKSDYRSGSSETYIRQAGPMQERGLGRYEPGIQHYGTLDMF